MRIHIVDMPTGPAPEDVRKAWIGMRLQLLAGYDRRVTRLTVSSPRPISIIGWLIALVTGRIKIMRGYFVDANEAVEQLSKSAPFAANWFREQWPQSLAPGMVFMFNSG